MIYTIEVVKQVVQWTEIEGNTLREVLQKLVNEDQDWEWEVPNDGDVDNLEPSEIVGVSYEGITTMKQEREMLKQARKIWKEIG